MIAAIRSLLRPGRAARLAEECDELRILLECQKARAAAAERQLEDERTRADAARRRAADDRETILAEIGAIRDQIREAEEITHAARVMLEAIEAVEAGRE